MVSEKMIFEGSLSLKARDLDTTLVCKSPSATDKDSNVSDRATSGNGDRLGTSDQNVISSSEKASLYQNINTSREKGSADQNVNPSEEKARTGRTDQNINISRDKRSTENIDQYVNSSREKGSTDLNMNYSLEKGSADKFFNFSMQQASTTQNFNTSSEIRSTDQNFDYSVNKGSKDPNVNSSIDKGSTDENVNSSRQQGGTHRYQAALRLQKVYKSFRTRRQLADCAILVEQRWWKVLDFAELKRSSISFFDIEKPETAVSRWARARTRAAKVGKGLSKDKKARKLALQHWLEAIDPRHRYGHNLHYYYAKWLHCDSKQPFFYWLDVGDGREISHETCPRSKLQTQCIKYLGPAERMAYEVVVDGGKFRYKESGILLDTTKGPKETKWIFVLSVSKDLYVGQKSKGTFQHSSFVAGGATLSAGRLVVENGILKSVWPHSGHYLPTEENFQEFMSFLKEHNVDLTNVQKSPGEDDEEAGFSKKSSNIGIRKSPQNAGSTKDSGTMNAEDMGEMSTDLRKEDTNSEENPPLMSRLPEKFCSKIAKLEIPQKDNALDIFKEQLPLTCREHFPDSDSDTEDGYETAEESLLTEEHFMVAKMNLFDEDQFEENEKPISKEKIMKRIDSHKGMKSYQLGQHLTSRWTTGAGPRIGCMRDYPAELQFRVLQQANLSPRQVARNSRIPAPSLFRESNAAVSLVAPSSNNRHFTVG